MGNRPPIGSWTEIGPCHWLRSSQDGAYGARVKLDKVSRDRWIAEVWLSGHQGPDSQTSCSTRAQAMLVADQDLIAYGFRLLGGTPSAPLSDEDEARAAMLRWDALGGSDG